MTHDDKCGLSKPFLPLPVVFKQVLKAEQSKASSPVCDLTALKFLQALSVPSQASGKSRESGHNGV